MLQNCSYSNIFKDDGDELENLATLEGILNRIKEQLDTTTNQVTKTKIEIKIVIKFHLHGSMGQKKSIFFK